MRRRLRVALTFPAAVRTLALPAVVLVLALTGCGGASPPSTDDASTAASPEPSPATATSRATPTASPSVTSASVDPAPPGTGDRAWVAVSVATLWVEPGLARAVDAPACAAPADPAAWVAGMTTAQKRWLVGRLETQALFGTPVLVLETRGAWSRVAVPSQPTPRDALGYPGWLPTRQLTTAPPDPGRRIAVVRRPRAWSWETQALTGRVLQFSYGTRLPAVAWTPEWVEVLALDGRHIYLRRSAVALRGPGSGWPRVTGVDLVREAERFLGLPYLWAGTAGFGYDCSGLAYAIHRALGGTIPRDAGPQGARGERIAKREALLPGDLVFFRDESGSIHHVGLYIGEGTMIHAPRTGEAITTASIEVEPYVSEFAGGRRYWR